MNRLTRIRLAVAATVASTALSVAPVAGVEARSCYTQADTWSYSARCYDNDEQYRAWVMSNYYLTYVGQWRVDWGLSIAAITCCNAGYVISRGLNWKPK